MKNFNKKSLALFAIGVVLIASAVITISSQNQKAKASTTTTYTFNWNGTKWRNVNTPLLNISLGIAEWTVTGSVAGKNITEIWQVPTGGWMEGINYDLNPTNSGSFSTGSFIAGSAGNYTRIDGPYVGEYFYPNIQNNYTVSAFSFPTKWTVSGTITTP